MKAFSLFLLVGLFTIIAQTTVLRIPFLRGCIFDLLIPLIVFLSLHRPNRQGIALALILGLVMDVVSGGVFGLYLSVYFWIFVWARGLSKYFDVKKTLFQSILIGLFVAAQHLVFWASVPAAWSGTRLLADRATPVVLQIILGALTGPGILLLLRTLQTRLCMSRSATRKEIGEFETE